MQAAPFKPRSVVVLSELEPAERRRYVEILARRGAAAAPDSRAGAYVSNLRILAPGLAAPAKPAPKKPRSPPPPPLKARVEAAAAAPETRLLEDAPAVVGGVDAGLYARFTGLVWRGVRAPNETAPPAPRIRSLAWLMRNVEDLYDTRYARDAADAQSSPKRGGDPLRRFPAFAVDALARRFGLAHIVEQHCWDLVCSAHAHRSHDGDAEVFCRFLSEIYDADDLLFYLYVRSVAARVLALDLAKRWAPERLEGPARTPVVSRGGEANVPSRYAFCFVFLSILSKCWPALT